MRESQTCNVNLEEAICCPGVVPSPLRSRSVASEKTWFVLQSYDIKLAYFKTDFFLLLPLAAVARFCHPVASIASGLCVSKETEQLQELQNLRDGLRL